jgi:hypothetical protein
MKPFVQMTGPHPSRIWRGGTRLPAWEVAVISPERQPFGKVYRCLSYRRAVSLSCNIARDRLLYLHFHALPA